MPPKARVVTTLLLAAITLEPPPARPQNVPVTPSEDRSFYLGQPIAHPEDLSGLWEAPNGKGGIIGIHLSLATTIPSSATSLAGIEQSWLHLQVALYERADASIPGAEMNGFSDSLRGGSVHYNGSRLTLHYDDFDLDLSRVRSKRGDRSAPENRWFGRYHRNGFDRTVTLTRPAPLPGARAPWFLGTWAGGNSGFQTCLHITQSSSGDVLGWSDSLQLWGLVRFAPTVQKPPSSLEHYGDIARIQPRSDGRVSLELHANTAICCSHSFIASPQQHGTLMQADWPPGPNQSPHQSTWTKMPGNSCLVPIHEESSRTSYKPCPSTSSPTTR